ncbi:hypothetical protein BHE74_00010695 [Ensete ventricosum]|nr:hypothetical protein BHE74_00010695 [Ensete ventricosum]
MTATTAFFSSRCNSPHRSLDIRYNFRIHTILLLHPCRYLLYLSHPAFSLCHCHCHILASSYKEEGYGDVADPYWGQRKRRLGSRETGANDDNRGGGREEEKWRQVRREMTFGCRSGLEMATPGRGRRGVGAGTRHRLEEKEEDNSEGPTSIMVSPGLVVNICKKKWLLTAAWLQVTTSTTNDNNYRLAKEEEGNGKQGKWQCWDKDGSERLLW